MEESRELLSIYKEPDGVSANWKAQNADDVIAVAVAIADFARRHDTFMLLLLGTIKEVLSNKEFQQTLEDHVVEMPDFDLLLKNLKNG